MIGDVPVVTFDTSAHNRLADGSASSRRALEGMNSQLWFRFAGLSVEELYATSRAEDRKALFASCRALQRGPSECLLPPNKLTEQLVLAHRDNPKNFDWKAVNVRWPRCEGAIRDPEFFDDDETSEGQREFQKERKKVGKEDLVDLRSRIQSLFEAHGETPPTAFRPALSRLESVGAGGSVMYAAHQFYDRAAGSGADDAVVSEFMDHCPPFRALVYAIFIPWYNTAVRDYVAGEKLNAGYNDLFMSLYLPYCDWFVTDDEGQEKSLREVAAHAGLETEILQYHEFCGRLLAAV